MLYTNANPKSSVSRYIQVAFAWRQNEETENKLYMQVCDVGMMVCEWMESMNLIGVVICVVNHEPGR